MKRVFSFIAAVLFAFAALGGLACSTEDTDKTTPAPSAKPTASPTRDSMLNPSASPSASPEVSPSPKASSSPVIPSMSPDTSTNPNATPGADELISGFIDGRVIDPSEIPEITSAITREFPEHSIQSVTHALHEGHQVYRVVLQGSGELSRVIFVYPGGNMLLPAAED